MKVNENIHNLELNDDSKILINFANELNAISRKEFKIVNLKKDSLKTSPYYKLHTNIFKL